MDHASCIIIHYDNKNYIGLSTCYDLRFPEMYQELSSTGEADILLVPSAFTVPTGQAHWHTLLRGMYY
jgi:nitrilase